MNRKRMPKMKQEIERRGGQMYIDPRMPSDVAEAFMRTILECPDCAREMIQKDRMVVEGGGPGHGPIGGH
jgi:hypothetical protein